MVFLQEFLEKRPFYSGVIYSEKSVFFYWRKEYFLLEEYLEKRPIFSEVMYRRIAGEKMVFLEDYLESFSRGLSREKNG
jgi:hypothetical protein